MTGSTTTGEEKRCELCGRRRGRTASIHIEGRGNLLVCIPCADEEERRKQKPAGGRRVLAEGDAAINARLLEDDSAVTFCPTTRETRAYFDGRGLTPTDAYVERFRSGVITAGLGASMRGAKVTAAEVAQLIADDVAEIETGVRPEREPPAGEPTARVVMITGGDGGRGCAFALVLPAGPGARDDETGGGAEAAPQPTETRMSTEIEELFKDYEAGPGGIRLLLFYVYGDDGDEPSVIINPPADLPELLAEWNALDRRMGDDQLAEGEEWDDIGTWLRARGVVLVQAPGICLNDYHRGTTEPGAGDAAASG